jgi:subtilase family serine protease
VSDAHQPPSLTHATSGLSYKTINRASLSGGTSVSFPVTFVTSLTNGAFTMRAFADNTCSLTEISEANNQATSSYSVVVSPADLVVQSLVLNKATYTAGEAGSATMTVANTGGTSTGVVFSVKLFRDAALTVGCTTSYNAIVLRKALRPGASDTFVIPFTNTATLGAYTLRVLADGGCAVAESNETNNQATAPYTVGVGGASVENSGTPTTSP